MGNSLSRRLTFSLPLAVVLSLGVGMAVATNIAYRYGLGQSLPAIATASNLFQLEGISSYPAYKQVRLMKDAAVAARTSSKVSVSFGGLIKPGRIECVTPRYFDALGLPTLESSLFQPGDGHLAVVSMSVASAARAENGGVVPARILLAGREFVVAGVAPRAFRGLDSAPIDAWVPLETADRLCTPSRRSLLEATDAKWLTIIALKPGGTEGSISSEVSAIMASVCPVGTKCASITATPIGESQKSSELFRNLRVTLLGGVVLYCLTLANGFMLSVSGLSNSARDMLLRHYLGAPLKAHMWPIMSSSRDLILVTSLIAIPFSTWLISGANAFLPLGSSVDWTWTELTAITALLATIAVGIAFVVPSAMAVVAIRARGQERSLTTTRRWRYGAIALQATLAVIVITGAGQAAAVLRELVDDLGFEPQGVLAIGFDPGQVGAGHSLELTDLASFLSGDPSVTVARTSGPVLGLGRGAAVSIVFSDSSSTPTTTQLTAVSADYFRVIGGTVLQGRLFEPTDETTDRHVMVISSRLADELWPSGDSIGRCAYLTTSR